VEGDAVYGVHRVAHPVAFERVLFSLSEGWKDTNK
jgi:hypothetical protein